MSRTYKDRPNFVKRAEAMKQGKIDHNHTLAGTSYWRREIHKTVEVLASDQEEIARLKEIYQNREDITLKIEQVKAQRRYDIDITGRHLRVFYTPKMLKFHVIFHAKFIKPGWCTEYCTDAEHYDARSQTDTRDDKRTTCDPDVPYHKGPRRHGKTSTTKRRAKLDQIRKCYNAETDWEALDEDAESVEVTMNYGAKSWSFD